MEQLKGAVRYEDFGAVGDGVTEDSDAIYRAHEYANANGLPIIGRAGASYYINNVEKKIQIKTDVDWSGARIIIDDSNVTTKSNQSEYLGEVKNLVRDCGTFAVSQDGNLIIEGDALAELNAKKDENGFVLRGLESGAENRSRNAGFAPGYPALLQIRNSETKNYIRYGYANTTGYDQREIVLVDKDGNIDESTPLLHDYTAVTSIAVHRADTKPITIKNATIESRASLINTCGGYHAIGRGFDITRANVTLENIVHEIKNEIPKNRPVRRDENGLSVIADGYTFRDGAIYDKNGEAYMGDDIKPFVGHIYAGIVCVSMTHNTHIKNVTFQARVFYISGTYDLQASFANKLVFENCGQSNFFEPDGITVGMGRCWGVAGTNYCKNMDYLNCRLTRYDAHASVVNGKIIGGETAVLRLTGGGEFRMEGVKIHAYGGSGYAPFQLREDYGATFNGTLIIKDCEIVPSEGREFCIFESLIGMPASYWDMGYKTFCPDIIIDNLKVKTDKKALYISCASPNGYNMKFDRYHTAPFRYIYGDDPSDPKLSGCLFHYETSKPDEWVAENITRDGARFHGLEYEVHSFEGGRNSTVIVKDTYNRYPYHAPKFIKVLNNADKPYKLLVIDCPFFRNNTEVTGDFEWTAPLE